MYPGLLLSHIRVNRRERTNAVLLRQTSEDWLRTSFYQSLISPPPLLAISTHSCLSGHHSIPMATLCTVLSSNDSAQFNHCVFSFSLLVRVALVSNFFSWFMPSKIVLANELRNKLAFLFRRSVHSVQLIKTEIRQTLPDFSISYYCCKYHT